MESASNRKNVSDCYSWETSPESYSPGVKHCRNRQCSASAEWLQSFYFFQVLLSIGRAIGSYRKGLWGMSQRCQEVCLDGKFDKFKRICYSMHTSEMRDKNRTEPIRVAVETGSMTARLPPGEKGANSCTIGMIHVRTCYFHTCLQRQVFYFSRTMICMRRQEEKHGLPGFEEIFRDG